MDNNDLQFFLIFNTISAWAIQALKTSPWGKWLQSEEALAVRCLSALVSSLGAAGIIVHASNQGQGNFTLTVSGATAYALAHWVWLTLGNYTAQKLIYKKGFKETAPAGATNPTGGTK